jgi:hypothetical protein
MMTDDRQLAELGAAALKFVAGASGAKIDGNG